MTLELLIVLFGAVHLALNQQADVVGDFYARVVHFIFALLECLVGFKALGWVAALRVAESLVLEEVVD